MNQAQKKYLKYLKQHIANVNKAYEFLLPYIKQQIDLREEILTLDENIKKHDLSKFQQDEFVPYANYFYGKRSQQSEEEFKKAEKLHKQRNPHHAEYWEDKNQVMPTVYVVEMVCDWWAFSLAKNQPLEIFDFYKNYAEKHPSSQEAQHTIDVLFKAIKEVSKEELKIIK